MSTVIPSIQSVLQNWIKHYMLFCPEQFQSKTDEKYAALVVDEAYAIDRMNGGDCGTTAIAVSHVMNQLIREAHPTGSVELVALWDNYNHAYVEYGERYYDTTAIEGKASRSEMMEADAPNMVEEQLSLATLFKRYIHRDRIGARLIRLFCIRYHLAEPVEVTELLETPMQRRDEFLEKWIGYTHDTLDVCDEFRPKPEDNYTEPAEPIEIEGPLDPDPSASIIARL